MLFRAGRVIKYLSNFAQKRYSTSLANLTEAGRIEALRVMAQSKSRENPEIMKLDSPLFHSIFTEELTSLASIFKEHGYEIRIAGGAVRDILLGFKPKDLDFATTATPTQMKEMFAAENVRLINANGEKHGTITPRINDKENFEVTTLRIDVVTDGRHAEVQFTTDWLLDALRRDLTINSMFLGLDGVVYDYFYGHDDLKNRKIKFVGDPGTRIQEDYLRILRYFRFYGKIAEAPDAHEEATLKAIVDNREGLGRISGERIWTELRKMLEGAFAGNLLLKIVECGLGPYIGLPPTPNTDELSRVWSRSDKLELHPITLLVSLLKTQDEVLLLNTRLKLSAFERDLALFVVGNREPKLHAKPLMPYKQLVLKNKSKLSDNLKFVTETLKYNNSPYLEEFNSWTVPTFPVSGHMLKSRGVENGRMIGTVLTELRHHWADNDFNLDAEQLLEQVPQIVNVLTERKRNK